MIPLRVGCPIRTSRDHRSLASPPGFSQRATSFIASQCQGIHQMPFLALDPGVLVTRRRRNAAAHRGKTPTQRPRMKTLLRIGAQLLLRRAYPPRSHDKLSLHPSINTPPQALTAPRAVSLDSSPNAAAARPAVRGQPHKRRRNAPAGQCAAAGVMLRGGRGGGERVRTDDLLLAKQALSQLSYTPGQKTDVRTQKSRISAFLRFCISAIWMVGQGGFEPPTSRLSSARSNQLSY